MPPRFLAFGIIPGICFRNRNHSGRAIAGLLRSFASMGSREYLPDFKRARSIARPGTRICDIRCLPPGNGSGVAESIATRLLQWPWIRRRYILAGDCFASPSHRTPIRSGWNALFSDLFPINIAARNDGIDGSLKGYSQPLKRGFPSSRRPLHRSSARRKDPTICFAIAPPCIRYGGKAHGTVFAPESRCSPICEEVRACLQNRSQIMMLASCTADR